MRTMSERLRALLADVTTGVRTLASSSTELSVYAGQTSAAVNSMSERTTTVSAAAEESSANTVSVAASMEQTSGKPRVRGECDRTDERDRIGNRGKFRARPLD